MGRSPWGSVRKLPSGRFQARYCVDLVGHNAPTTFRTKRASGSIHDPRSTSARTEARYASASLQVALIIPILAALLGLVNSMRMMRLPDPEPSSSTEGMMLGRHPPGGSAACGATAAVDREAVDEQHSDHDVGQ
jgi:hypothetical protein